MSPLSRDPRGPARPRLLLAVVAAALAVAACDRLSRFGKETPVASSSAPGLASGAPSALSAAVEVITPPPVDSALLGPGVPLASAQVAPAAGPAPSGSATREERQQRLLALLSGATIASALPVDADAPGGGFDIGLRARLTTIEVPTGDHHSRPPVVRVGATSVTGRLPPEVISRIVRQNFGRFRLCYENGLKSNPNLQGRVSVKFVIGKDGSVSTAINSGSDLPDPAVVACIVQIFPKLSFPQPESGIVVVNFPISLSPGD